MLDKIHWNENGPRVTGRRPFVVCCTNRFASEAEQGPLVEKRSVCEAKVSCHWFKKYVSDQKEDTLRLGTALDNEKGPCSRRRGPRITGKIFTRTKSPVSSG